MCFLRVPSLCCVLWSLLDPLCALCTVLCRPEHRGTQQRDSTEQRRAEHRTHSTEPHTAVIDAPCHRTLTPPSTPSPFFPLLLSPSSAMSVLASPTGAAADFMQIRMHIPASQPCDAVDGGDAAVDRSSIAFHAAQLSAPSRSQLLQGESLHFYLLLPPSLLARHPWLQLPWGRKLVKAARKAREAREDEERFTRQTHSEAEEKAAADEEQCTPEQQEQRARAADALVLQRSHPCPHQMHIRLRVVGAEECSEARRQIREQSCATEDETHATDDVDEPREDAEDDDGEDIVHDPQANEERTDSDDDEPHSDTERRRASMGGASTSTDKSSSHSSHRRKSSSTSASSSHRPPQARPAFAFRKSTLSLPSARSARHHPSKLAPGYSPSFHGHSGHASGSSAAGSTKEVAAPWNHVQSDAHSSSSVAAPPQVEYFYFEPSLDPATAAQAGESNQGPWLVMHVSTCISILPSYLSSPASMPFEQACCVSAAGSGGSEALSSPMMHLLSLELDLVSPPAKHHQSLNHATLHLPNTGQFLLENPLPSASVSPSLTAGGSLSAGTAGGFGFNNLRAFVAQNRALQVPHLIPPARSYVTVVEPLQLSSKSICLGSAGGGGDGGDGGCNDTAAADADGVDSSPPADICIEFTLLNLSSRWTLCVQRLDFILNRSRIFLKILAPPPTASTAAVSSSATPSNASAAGSAALPPLTLSSPANGSPMLSSAHHGLPPTPSSHHAHHAHHGGGISRAEHRSVHYLPLGNFFPSSLDSSALPTKLRPHEQLNLLCFLSAPTRAALTNLESMVRGLLAAGGSVSHPSFSLATTSLPYRTPYTLRYTVEGVGSQDPQEAVVAQNKTIWRSVSVANTPAATVAAAVMSRAGAVPRMLLQSPSSSSAPSPSPTSQSGLHSSAVVPFSKLSLRLRVSSSPVVLHRPFALFVSVLNHHASLATNALQVVVLPETHEVVRAAREASRAEEEAAVAATGRRRAGGEESVASAAPVHPLHQPFSPSSPAPPLLFSPHTPFSPNTPWISRDSVPASGDSQQPDGSPRTREMHFPFQAVGATIDRRAHSSSSKHGHAALPLSRHPISVHTGDADSTASAVSSAAGLSLSSVSRQDSTSSGEVLTTTLAHFLSADPPPHDSSNGVASNGLLAHAASASDEHASPQTLPSADGSRSLSSSSDHLSSLVCLETSLSLGVIPPQSERSVTLHYLALREGMLALSGALFLFDPETRIYYRPAQQATVFAVKQ